MKWFYKLSIGHKLIIFTGLMCLFIVGLSLYGMVQLDNINENVDRMYSQNLTPMIELEESAALIKQFDGLVMDIAILDLTEEELEAKQNELDSIQNQIEKSLPPVRNCLPAEIR